MNEKQRGAYLATLASRLRLPMLHENLVFTSKGRPRSPSSLNQKLAREFVESNPDSWESALAFKLALLFIPHQVLDNRSLDHAYIAENFTGGADLDSLRSVRNHWSTRRTWARYVVNRKTGLDQRISPAPVVGEPYNWLRLFTGRYAFGTKWECGDTRSALLLDIDGESSTNLLDVPSEFRLALLSYLEAAWVEMYRQADTDPPVVHWMASGGRGLWLHVFFDEPVPTVVLERITSSYGEMVGSVLTGLGMWVDETNLESQGCRVPLSRHRKRPQYACYLDLTTGDPFPDQNAYIMGIERTSSDPLVKLYDFVREGFVDPILSLSDAGELVGYLLEQLGSLPKDEPEPGMVDFVKMMEPRGVRELIPSISAREERDCRKFMEEAQGEDLSTGGGGSEEKRGESTSKISREEIKKTTTNPAPIFKSVTVADEPVLVASDTNRRARGDAENRESTSLVTWESLASPWVRPPKVSNEERHEWMWLVSEIRADIAAGRGIGVLPVLRPVQPGERYNGLRHGMVVQGVTRMVMEGYCGRGEIGALSEEEVLTYLSPYLIAATPADFTEWKPLVRSQLDYLAARGLAVPTLMPLDEQDVAVASTLAEMIMKRLSPQSRRAYRNDDWADLCLALMWESAKCGRQPFKAPLRSLLVQVREFSRGTEQHKMDGKVTRMSRMLARLTVEERTDCVVPLLNLISRGNDSGRSSVYSVRWDWIEKQFPRAAVGDKRHELVLS